MSVCESLLYLMWHSQASTYLQFTYWKTAAFLNVQLHLIHFTNANCCRVWWWLYLSQIQDKLLFEKVTSCLNCIAYLLFVVFKILTSEKLIIYLINVCYQMLTYIFEHLYNKSEALHFPPLIVQWNKCLCWVFYSSVCFAAVFQHAQDVLLLALIESVGVEA